MSLDCNIQDIKELLSNFLYVHLWEIFQASLLDVGILKLFLQWVSSGAWGSILLKGVIGFERFSLSSFATTDRNIGNSTGVWVRSSAHSSATFCLGMYFNGYNFKFAHQETATELRSILKIPDAGTSSYWSVSSDTWAPTEERQKLLPRLLKCQSSFNKMSMPNHR